LLKWIEDLLKRAELVGNFSTGKTSDDFAVIIKTWGQAIKTQSPTDEELRYIEARIFLRPVTLPNFSRLLSEYRDSAGLKSKLQRQQDTATALEKKENKVWQEELDRHILMASMTIEEVEKYIDDIVERRRQKEKDTFANEFLFHVGDEESILLPLWKDEMGNVCHFKMTLKETLKTVRDVYMWRYGEHVLKYKGQEKYDNLPKLYKIKPFPHNSISSCFKKFK